MRESGQKIIAVVALVLLFALPVVGASYVLANAKQVDAANVVSGLLAPLAITIGGVGQVWAKLRSRGGRATDDQLDSAVAELARQSQAFWRKEAFSRGITVSVALRVAWQWTTSVPNAPSAEDVSAPVSAGAGPQRIPAVGRRPRLVRSGGLPQLHELYRRLDRGRLVVLGEKGAGKT
ncbi:hypothetical protein SK571_43335, partial [Lentzea sp. BCCO 10_0798]|nr:hypothetical protein [Lentzea sp. BCCO 10_0798]